MEKEKPSKEEREAHRIRQSALRKVLRASRAQAYEANWNERSIQDRKDETFSGWRQPVAGGELGGWVERSSPASSTTMTLESNWKRKLQQELQEKDYGGWIQPTGEEPLGGWLYPATGVEDYQTEVEILGQKVSRSHILCTFFARFMLSITKFTLSFAQSLKKFSSWFCLVICKNVRMWLMW